MRAKTWISLLAVPVLLAVALSDVQGQPTPAPDSETQRIIRGFNIAPVPLKLRGRNRALVGLGSYIVNAQGGCNDCREFRNIMRTGHDPDRHPQLGPLLK
ncbi:MAG TPA: hypothetical protein VGC93_16180 [Thermoanaerobaculia bacterium]